MMASTVFPDVALPNVALPIARGQCGCLTKNPQSARPLNAATSVKLTAPTKTNAATRPFQPATMPQSGPFDYGPKIQTMHYPKISNIVICDRWHYGKE